MRKVVMLNRISIDGYFASLNETSGGMDWFIPDTKVDDALHNLDSDNADTVLLGATTFMMFESSWLPILQDPHASADKKAIAQELTNMKKVVFAEKIHTTDWANTEFHATGVVDTVIKLKQQQGGTIMIMGSGSITQQLTNARLIDEYIFILTPIIAGQGKPLFKDVSPLGLQLISAKSFDSGNVVLRYQRIANAGT